MGVIKKKSFELLSNSWLMCLCVVILEGKERYKIFRCQVSTYYQFELGKRTRRRRKRELLKGQPRME